MSQRGQVLDVVCCGSWVTTEYWRAAGGSSKRSRWICQPRASSTTSSVIRGWPKTEVTARQPGRFHSTREKLLSSAISHVS